MVDFEQDIVGREFDFYGVDNLMFKLGDHVFEAIEDESDGLRSYLDVVELKDPDVGIFFDQPIATVRIVEVDDPYGDEGYQFIGTDGHVWLTIGTKWNDDYYPTFVFRYEPQESKG